MSVLCLKTRSGGLLILMSQWNANGDKALFTWCTVSVSQRFAVGHVHMACVYMCSCACGWMVSCWSQTVCAQQLTDTHQLRTEGPTRVLGHFYQRTHTFNTWHALVWYSVHAGPRVCLWRQWETRYTVFVCVYSHRYTSHMPQAFKVKRCVHRWPRSIVASAQLMLKQYGSGALH